MIQIRGKGLVHDFNKYCKNIPKFKTKQQRFLHCRCSPTVVECFSDTRSRNRACNWNYIVVHCISKVPVHYTLTVA